MARNYEYTIKLDQEQFVFLQRCLDKVDLEVFGKEVYGLERKISETKVQEVKDGFRKSLEYWLKQISRVAELNSILNSADWKFVEVEEEEVSK